MFQQVLLRFGVVALFPPITNSHTFITDEKLISSPEPLGSPGELMVYPFSGGRRRGRQQFQTSSPLKPLGQSMPNFMWNLLRKEE